MCYLHFAFRKPRGSFGFSVIFNLLVNKKGEQSNSFSIILRNSDGIFLFYNFHPHHWIHQVDCKSSGVKLKNHNYREIFLHFLYRFDIIELSLCSKYRYNHLHVTLILMLNSAKSLLMHIIGFSMMRNSIHYSRAQGARAESCEGEINFYAICVVLCRGRNDKNMQ